MNGTWYMQEGAGTGVWHVRHEVGNEVSGRKYNGHEIFWKDKLERNKNNITKNDGKMLGEWGMRYNGEKVWGITHKIH